MQKGTFEDIKEVIRSNDQIQMISAEYYTTTENNINWIPIMIPTLVNTWNNFVWTVWNEMFNKSVK